MIKGILLFVDSNLVLVTEVSRCFVDVNNAAGDSVNAVTNKVVFGSNKSHSRHSISVCLHPLSDIRGEVSEVGSRQILSSAIVFFKMSLI
jgi:hypothetical protein